jgi:hypothetical protein
MLSDGLAQSQDIMGLPLSAPLTSYETIYSLPMLNIKDNKVRCDGVNEGVTSGAMASHTPNNCVFRFLRVWRSWACGPP